jgi:hypothetical protein
LLVSPNIGKFLRAGRQVFFSLKRYCKSGFCYLSCESQKIYHKGFAMPKILLHSSGVNKSPSPTPGASNFHIWASWNNQLYARRASKNIYRILTNLSIFAYLLIFIYVICCLISSNVLFIQPLAFCRKTAYSLHKTASTNDGLPKISKMRYRNDYFRFCR